jgi:hypothetical protein
VLCGQKSAQRRSQGGQPAGSLQSCSAPHSCPQLPTRLQRAVQSACTGATPPAATGAQHWPQAARQRCSGLHSSGSLQRMRQPPAGAAAALAAAAAEHLTTRECRSGWRTAQRGSGTLTLALHGGCTPPSAACCAQVPAQAWPQASAAPQTTAQGGQGRTPHGAAHGCAQPSGRAARHCFSQGRTSSQGLGWQRSSPARERGGGGGGGRAEGSNGTSSGARMT